MKSWFGRLRATVWGFWFLSVGLTTLSLFVAIYLYRLKFGGELSSSINDWSGFGSYIGGVFGPLISFLTLLAVLQTVYLQRELLKVQGEEFAKLHELQVSTLQRQDDQLDLAKLDSDRTGISAYQATQLKLIEMYIDQQRRASDSVEGKIKDIMAASLEPGIKLKMLNDLDERKKVFMGRENDFLVLLLEISIFEFKSIQEIKQVLGPRLLDILGISPTP